MSQMTWTVVLMGGIYSHWEGIMLTITTANTRAERTLRGMRAANRERGGGHLLTHTGALEHSRAPGPGTLAGAGIRQHDEESSHTSPGAEFY